MLIGHIFHFLRNHDHVFYSLLINCLRCLEKRNSKWSNPESAFVQLWSTSKWRRCRNLSFQSVHQIQILFFLTCSVSFQTWSLRLLIFQSAGLSNFSGDGMIVEPWVARLVVWKTLGISEIPDFYHSYIIRWVFELSIGSGIRQSCSVG